MVHNTTKKVMGRYVVALWKISDPIGFTKQTRHTSFWHAHPYDRIGQILSNVNPVHLHVRRTEQPPPPEHGFFKGTGISFLEIRVKCMVRFFNGHPIRVLIHLWNGISSSVGLLFRHLNPQTQTDLHHGEWVCIPEWFSRIWNYQIFSLLVIR
ncbi:MAG TPA: hypothetical protein PLK63_16590 [Catalimonadaceae bacterium]|nr:hypothetical protein [Catalimonadaceae bacterium]